MKRIVYITQQYPPEASANASRIDDMVRNLIKRGHEVVVVCPHPTFPFGLFRRAILPKKIKKSDKLSVVRLPTWQPSESDPPMFSRLLYYLLFPFFSTIWCIFNNKKFDVMICSSPPIFTALPVLLNCKMFQKLAIVEVRDLWIDASIGLGFMSRGGMAEKIGRAFEKKTLDAANMITVVTNSIRKRLTELYSVSEEKVKTVPNGTIIPNCVKKDSDSRTIFFAGNLGHAYDLQHAIMAMKYVIDDRAVLVIAGDGDLKHQLESVVRREHLEKKVKFIGVIPRELVFSMLSDAALGIIPYKNLDGLDYCQPVKAYECMACKTAYVGCGGEEFKELTRLSGAGEIVEGNPKSISDAINRLLRNKELRMRMGINGHEFVKKNFNRETIAYEFSNEIESILV